VWATCGMSDIEFRTEVSSKGIESNGFNSNSLIRVTIIVADFVDNKQKLLRPAKKLP
jgi:hypothetical protein